MKNLTNNQKIDASSNLLLLEHFTKVKTISIEVIKEGTGSLIKDVVRVESLLLNGHINNAVVSRVLEIANSLKMEFHIINGGIQLYA